MATTDGLAGLTPLEPDDPPRLGDYQLSGRLLVDDTAVVYLGADGRSPVAVVMLNKGASVDPAARGRFRVCLRRVAAADPESLAGYDVHPEVAPWAAVPLAADGAIDGAVDGVPDTVRQLLDEVALRPAGGVGPGRGPDFAPPWSGRGRPGFWRLWPLPWPASLNTASRLTHLLSLAVMVLLATLAIVIALWVFDDQPPAKVPLPTQPSNGPSSSPTRGPSTPPPTPGQSGSPTGGRGVPPIV